jgi:hypothetical protein
MHCHGRDDEVEVHVEASEDVGGDLLVLQLLS